MFVLHSSNKTENLLEHLAAVIAHAPLSSPFVREVFLIQSQGMERWLSQQLASRFQVFANFEFLFPGRFFSVLAQQIDVSLLDADFDRQLMLWRIETLLRHPDGDDFAPIRHYLAGDQVALKRFQLAQQLAQMFDQYQIMRPDMLSAWQQHQFFYGSDIERWQRRLWQGIVAAIGERHRGTMWLEVIALLNGAEPGAFADVLPERISVFGLNTMPPLFLHYLQSVARHCQLHLFLLNPAQGFWADLPGLRQRAGDETPDGHPLLSALGQQGREFQEMLLEQAQFDLEPESFELTAAINVLQHLQNDILTQSTGKKELEADGSIAVHACHSRMREVEVIKDQLLHVLENDRTLELRDIVVMAPDIELYEPFVSAVFHDVQHAVADRSLKLTNRLLDAFISFLKLSQSRFGWQAVLDLLDRPVVYPSFGLTENDLELIRHWLKEIRVRWGRSSEHWRELGLPELEANTWRAALDRLLMGFAVGVDDEFVDGILPYAELEGSSALALGGLCDYMDLLFQASETFRRPCGLADWAQRLFGAAEQLFRPDDSIERQELYQILSTLADRVAAVHDGDVELAVIVAWLEGQLTERKSSTGFLRGQLTFCSMLPMRSIPFRIIALLGMNEGEFPRIDRHPTFDLLAQNFRKGDRSHRADDRYQFLEILLSARDFLIITYVGQSIRSNEPMPPSVVVAELLDVLTQQYGLARLTIFHPLQSFSSRYYDGSSPLFSFSEAGLETAKALSTAIAEYETPSTDWWQGSLDESEEVLDIIELDDLFRFFQHPQRYFLRRQLDLRFAGLELEAEEREPFVVDRFDGYAIAQDWITEQLQGRELSLQKLQAQGLWPPGVPGELEFQRRAAEIEQFCSCIEALEPGRPLDDLAIDFNVGGFRLIGKLGNRYQRCGLIYRYANLKGKDFLGAWLYHLIINRVAAQATHLLSTDENLAFPADMGSDNDLSPWLNVFRQGQLRPDAFFIEAAFAYVKQARLLQSGGRSSKPALECAREQWAHSIMQPYEPELHRLYGHLTDPGSVLGEPFERQCEELLLPVWMAVKV